MAIHSLTPIIVDNHEPKEYFERLQELFACEVSRIHKTSYDKGMKWAERYVTWGNLEKEFGCADYLCGDVAIERKKAAGDFTDCPDVLAKVSELLISDFKYVYLVVDGTLEQAYDYLSTLSTSADNQRIKISQVKGMVSSLCLMGTPPVFTESYEHLDILFEILQKGNDKKHDTLRLRNIRTESVHSDYRVAVLANAPSIGDEYAESILDHFGSVKAVVNASKRDYMNVSGIGPKRAEALYKTFNSTEEVHKNE